MAGVELILPRSRAKGKLNVSTGLEVRPCVAMQKGRHAAVSMMS